MAFRNEKIERQYQERIRAIDLLVNGAVDPQRYAWDSTARQCAVRVEQIKKLFDDEVFSRERDEEITDIGRDLSTFLSKCADPEYQVALVGTIKAGKSTLINALLNYELASTHITPETAALTKFKRADEDFVEVSFYTQDEWTELWKSATSTTNTVFVEEYNKLAEEMNSGVYFDDVYTYALRIDAKRFVSKDLVHFQAAETDAAIENTCSSDYFRYLLR